MGSVFTVFSTRTNFNKCLWCRYTHIVHDARTVFTIKTGCFPNIPPTFLFSGVSFAATNGTKILFCCVRYCKQFAMVKICAHIVDSLHSGFLRCPACLAAARRFRLLLDSTGGRGISGARVSRELAPQPPKSEKSPLPSPKSRKNKKGDFQFYKSSLRSLLSVLQFTQNTVRHFVPSYEYTISC